MARTYKDNPIHRGRKSRRSDRGDNRGRRWGNDEARAPRRLGSPDPRPGKRNWRESGENDNDL